MPKKKTTADRVSEVATTFAAPPLAFHRISALLHTMRAIDRHEEPLSTLMCEIKAAGRVDQDVREELCALLDDIHVRDLLVDLRAAGLAIDHATFGIVRKQKTTGKRGKKKKKARRKAAKKEKALKEKAKKRKKR
jgi:hypothetical protein